MPAAAQTGRESLDPLRPPVPVTPETELARAIVTTWLTLLTQKLAEWVAAEHRRSMEGWADPSKEIGGLFSDEGGA